MRGGDFVAEELALVGRIGRHGVVGILSQIVVANRVSTVGVPRPEEQGRIDAGQYRLHADIGKFLLDNRHILLTLCAVVDL